MIAGVAFNLLVALIRRYPVVSFVALAYGLTWALLPLAHRHTSVAVLVLLCPAMAAFAIALVCGHGAAQELRAALLRWRLHPRWYVLALTLPLPISLLAGLLRATRSARGRRESRPLERLRSARSPADRAVRQAHARYAMHR